MVLKKKVFLPFFIGFFLLSAGCTGNSLNQKALQPEVKTKANSSANAKLVSVTSQKIGQIQGIGFPGNDNALYVATNNGLKFYRGSSWLEYSANKNNYTSFQAVETGFLASGQPEQKSGLREQLGIVESVDQGKSLKRLAFYGKDYFHFLSASFFGGGMYTINEKPSGKLGLGGYYSIDQGKSWEKCRFADFTADSYGMIAVHAKSSSTMAMSTRTGIFYSQDFGNTMKAITGPVMVTALTFVGDDILFSSVEDKQIFLKKVNPKTGEQTNVIFPYLDYDNPITYVAADPKNENKLAFTTYKNDIYESNDGGKSWNSLVADGRIEQ